MYLRTLRYEGLKRLADTMNAPLDFTRNDKARPWTVLLGENGTCKTTLLQAIALAAVGPSTANTLAHRVRSSLQDIRRPRRSVVIEAEFEFDPEFHIHRRYPGLTLGLPHPPRLASRLELAPGKREWEGTSRYIAPPGVDPATRAAIEAVPDPLRAARSEVSMPFWLVAGYGVGRHLPAPGSTPPIDDPVLDRLRPLFGERAVTATDFADGQHFDTKAFGRMLKDALTRVATLVPELEDVELRGRPSLTPGQRLVEGHRFAMKLGDRRYKLPAIWLSQGYQSIIAWIADLIGHALLESAGRTFDPRTLSGLVLVDEVDLYLHPRWQVDLITALKEAFPRVQFIATTHSPMVLPGLVPDEIRRLHIADDGRVFIEAPDEDPRLKTGGELYSEFFGVSGLYPTELAEKAHQYRRLATNPFRTDPEQVELDRLAVELTAEGVRHTPPVPRRERRG